MIQVATEGSESAGRPSANTVYDLKGCFELIIPPPAEPESILTFHSWIERVGGSTITRASGNFHRGSVLSIYVANPDFFLMRLAEMPLVASLTEQRNASAETDARGENELGEANRNAGPTDGPRRFRVILNRSANPHS